MSIGLRKPIEDKQFLIRSLPENVHKDKISNIRQFRHENLIKTRAIYTFEDGIYIVSEFMDISLLHICRCPKYPEEIQIAGFISQVCFRYFFSASELTLHR